MFQSGIRSFINLREMKEGKQMLIETDLDQNIIPTTTMGTAINEVSAGKCNAEPALLSPNRDNHLNENSNEDDGVSPASSLHPLLSVATLENIVESQLACFVLMLDILLKQFELQEVTAHKGFDIGKDASNTIQLLYQMISVARCTTTVDIQVHTCCEYGNTLATDLGTAIPKPILPPNGNIQRHVNKPNTILNECFFCELSSIWYQLSLQLITYFAPMVEMTVMSDIGSIHGTESDHSNICLSPLSTRQQHQQQQSTDPNTHSSVMSDDLARSTPLYSINESPSDDHHSQPFLHTNTSALDESGDLNDNGDNPENYLDPGLMEDEEKLIASIDLNMAEKLTLKFLHELELQSDPDVIYHLLQCIKLLILHAGLLTKMAQDEKRTKKFFLWCQNRYLITTFWRLLQAEFSQVYCYHDNFQII